MSWFLIAALLYPSVVDTDANLFTEQKWRTRANAVDSRLYKSEIKTHGPFSPDEPVWTVETGEPKSLLWRQDVKLKTGHRYLVGAWFRRDRARALVWCFSRTKNGKPFDRRIYLAGGFNSCLDRYLKPELKKMLAGNTGSWQLVYRTIEVDRELACPAQFKFGIYMSTGSVEMSHPFLIDITDKRHIPLTAKVKSEKNITRLALEHVGVRDMVWEKIFTPPDSMFTGVIETSDALRGFGGANRIDGNMLSVTYADGVVENVYAPQENVFLSY